MSTYEGEHTIFGFLSQANLTQNDVLQFHPSIFEKEDKKENYDNCDMFDLLAAKIFLGDICSKYLWHPKSYLFSPPLFLVMAAVEISGQVHTHLVLFHRCTVCLAVLFPRAFLNARA
jgi:hypothetical protein